MDLLCDAIGFSSSQPAAGSEPAQMSTRSHPKAHSVEPPPPRFEQRPRAGAQRQCHLCGRSYERVDHLNRHLKSHENSRPHKCTRCNKSFNRADLLNRHQASHDRPVATRRSIDRGDRVAAACLACVNAKAKCQDEKPCTRCRRRGITCETSSGSTQNDVGFSVSKASSTQSSSQNQQASSNLCENGGPQSVTGIVNGRNDEILPPMYNSNSVPNGTVLDHSLASQNETTSNIQYEAQASNSAYYSGPHVSSNLTTSFLEYSDISCLPADTQFSPGLGLVPRDSYFSQDIDFGLWDFDLDSVELGYRSVDDAGSGRTDSQRPPNLSQSANKDASKRYAAFERSPWLWKPTQNDQALNDQHNLHVDEDSIPSVLTPASPATNGDMFTSCSIDYKQRDQMVSLLFTLRKTPNKSPSLPSLALLNSIIQVYFVQESFRVDHLIHAGTFTPSAALPQLLLSIVSAGSTLISTPAIWKMGLALQEVVRHTLGDYWEQDNTHTRNLQALQAFMIGLDVALWSGFKRKMEIAESFAQPIIIMLRRAGAFAAPGNPSSLDPYREDSEAILESKWRKWAERESFKRLVLHMFIHDVHSSIGFQKPPQISFTELTFYLPASRELWLAKSSTEWRDLYLSSEASRHLPTFVDAIHQPEILHQYFAQADVHLSSIALLHGHWGEIFSLNESKKFFPISKSTHRLWMHTAYTELYHDLSAFSLALPSLTDNSPEATLVAELLQMILHISPADLHRFAGKFGEDETRKATEDLAAWAKTKEARLAIWHAGQVFRAANRLLAAQNRGFNAIALYFASLTLWVYGHMAPNTSPSPGITHVLVDSNPSSSSGKQYVVLNEAETPKSSLFLANSQGVPVIGIESEEFGAGKSFVELGETGKILAVTRKIYRSNFPVLKEPLPPLVENLGNLLRDLGSLPGSRVSRAPSQDLI